MKMEMNEFSGTEWKIVKELVGGGKTTKELSKALGLSVPNVHRFLRRLESQGVAEKIREKRGKTKPSIVYSIGKGFIYFVKALPGEASKRFLKIDENLEVHFRIWSIPQKEYHYFVEKFWWDIQKDFEGVESLAVFGSVAKGEAGEDSDIDILIIANKIKSLEKKYGARLVRGKKKEGKTVMSQVYSKKDFKNSFKKGSKFAKEIVGNMKVIYDKNDFLLNLKKENDKR